MRDKRRVGAGNVFGAECFVMSTAFSLEDRFEAGSVSVYRVEGLGWWTRSWRSAAGKIRKTC